MAQHGWQLLPHYTFYDDTGEFRHSSIGLRSPHRRWLHSINFLGPTAAPAPAPAPADSDPAPASLTDSYAWALSEAARLCNTSPAKPPRATDAALISATAAACNLRWFVLPSEAQARLQRPQPVTARQPGPVVPVAGDGCILLVPLFTPLTNKPLSEPPAPPALDPGSVPLEAPEDVPAAACPLLRAFGTRTAAQPVLSIEETLQQEYAASAESLDPTWSAALDGSEISATGLDGAPNAGAVAPALQSTIATASAIDDSPAAVPTSNDASSAQLPVQPTFAASSLPLDGSNVESFDTEAAPAPAPSTLTVPRAEPHMFPTVPKSLMRVAGMAIRDYSMIRDGDRVLLGLSGGKDSLTLLHILHSLQRRAPIRFELAAVTMDPQFPGFDPSPLIGYMQRLGIPYFFESQPLLKLAAATNPVSICAWCSRMKRMRYFYFVF